MSYIINKYKIIYPDFNVIQFKNLILHNDYINIYKSLKSEIYVLEDQLLDLNKKKHKEKFLEINNQIKILKHKIKEEFSENIFTTESPLFKSQENNGLMILPDYQGGKIKVIIEKL